MKLFSSCKDCITCACYEHGCLAGNGDDDYIRASNEELATRLKEAETGMNNENNSDSVREQYRKDYNVLSSELGYIELLPCNAIYKLKCPKCGKIFQCENKTKIIVGDTDISFQATVNRVFCTCKE